MKLYQLLVSEHISGTVLYLIILLANIDYVGIIDYAIKAIIGSLVWFLFRVCGDYYTHELRRRYNEKQKKQ